MTIPKAVLCGLVGLMMTSIAEAQCSRGRPVTIGSVHRIHRIHQPILRPLISTPPRLQTVSLHGSLHELPPAPGSINFGECGHVGELAARLELLMNQLCLDLHYNYSHNPGFQITYAEAYSLYQTARFIHEAEHNFDRLTVQRQLNGVDALFHHLYDDVRGWSRIPRRQIGTMGITTKIAMAKETLQQLMIDVGVHAAPILEQPPVPGGIAPAGGFSPGLSVPPAPINLP